MGKLLKDYRAAKGSAKKSIGNSLRKSITGAASTQREHKAIMKMANRKK